MPEGSGQCAPNVKTKYLKQKVWSNVARSFFIKNVKPVFGEPYIGVEKLFGRITDGLGKVL